MEGPDSPGAPGLPRLYEGEVFRYQQLYTACSITTTICYILQTKRSSVSVLPPALLVLRKLDLQAPHPIFRNLSNGASRICLPAAISGAHVRAFLIHHLPYPLYLCEVFTQCLCAGYKVSACFSEPLFLVKIPLWTIQFSQCHVHIAGTSIPMASFAWTSFTLVVAVVGAQQ